MITIYDINAAIEIEERVFALIAQHRDWNNWTPASTSLKGSLDSIGYRIEALKHIRDNLT